MTTEEKTFGAICFIVLMSNGGVETLAYGGYMSKHPSYIDEKTILLEKGFDAYAHLDRTMQRKVIEYFKFWKLDLPEPIQQYEEDNAEASL